MQMPYVLSRNCSFPSADGDGSLHPDWRGVLAAGLATFGSGIGIGFAAPFLSGPPLSASRLPRFSTSTAGTRRPTKRFGIGACGQSFDIQRA
jgi:hypothetical protein